MRARALGVAVGAAIALVAAPAAAEDPRARFALTLDAFGGYDLMIQGRSSAARDEWSRNGGGAVAGSLALRTPWVSPFVDVGWYPLFASQARVDLGSGLGSARATSSLAAVGFVAGLGVELWRVRLRAGLGGYDVGVRSTVLGDTMRTRELDGGYLFSLRGAVVRSRRIDVGLEARFGFIVEADTSFASLGLALGGDAITF